MLNIADLSRRNFLVGAAASAASFALADPASEALLSLPTASGLKGRFLTHVSVVRVNQIEVTPTKNIGQDEAADNRPERIRSRREAFARGCPDGKMTWAISWLALHDNRKEYQEARRLLAEYHHRYGDEVTFIPGGYFAPMYDTREHNRKTIHDALQMVSKMVGGGYRPQCLVAGFMDAENQRHLAEDEGIHVCQGQIWSQHAIDNGDGDGGICYPVLSESRALPETCTGQGRFHRLRLPRWLDLRLPRRAARWVQGRIQQPHGCRANRDSRQLGHHGRTQRDDGYHCGCTSTLATR